VPKFASLEHVVLTPERAWKRGALQHGGSSPQLWLCSSDLLSKDFRNQPPASVEA
jgi:hypothetical protein